MQNTDAWYHDIIDTMVAKGWMNGMSKTIFAPNGNMTRAQFITVLYRMAGNPSVAGKTHPFRDVEADSWYTDAVIWGAENGIVNGTSATTFAPRSMITREQIATILFRYAKGEAGKDAVSAFPDADKISNFAKDAMNWAVAEQIILGDGNYLNPRGNATRAEAAAMLLRLWECAE